jgi:nucleotide-binding universal stress UspA family protein
MVGEVTGSAQTDAKVFVGTVEAVRREFPGLPIQEEFVRRVSPAGVLVEESGQADLLVVGAHRPGSPRVPRLGRVTHAVLHHAHCPVAVVPVD